MQAVGELEGEGGVLAGRVGCRLRGRRVREGADRQSGGDGILRLERLFCCVASASY